MNTARQIVLALTMALGVARPARALGEDDQPQGKMPEKLGEVSFPVSCNAAAQREFNRAMALFHSFWFDPAKNSFAKVLGAALALGVPEKDHTSNCSGVPG